MIRINLRVCLGVSLLVMLLGVSTSFAQTFIPTAIITLDYDRSSNRIATGHQDRSVRIWDGSTNQLLTTFPDPAYRWMDGEVPYSIKDIGLQPDGHLLAVSYGGLYEIGLIQVFDLQNNSLLFELEAHNTTGALSWSSDGALLATSSGASVGSNARYYLEIWSTPSFLE